MATTPQLLITHIEQAQSNKNVTANEAFDELDSAIAGRLDKDVAGSSNVTLTDIEARAAIIELTGVLTGNIDVIVPTRTKHYILKNGTTGSFTLTIKTSAGTGVVVDQKKWYNLICDGTNVVQVYPGTINENGDDVNFRIEGDTDAALFFLDAGLDRIAIGSNAPAAKLDITQYDAAAGVATLRLDQLDVDEEIIEIDGQSTADTASSITSWTTGNTIQGFVRVNINGTDRWMPFYDAPTS